MARERAWIASAAVVVAIATAVLVNHGSSRLLEALSFTGASARSPQTPDFADAKTPTIAIAQAAYDAAKSASRGRHIQGLKIDRTDCTPMGQARFLCQIRYARHDETNGRLHFTVIVLKHIQRRWALTAGLCRGDGSGPG
jgi:hypothetical protein